MKFATSASVQSLNNMSGSVKPAMSLKHPRILQCLLFLANCRKWIEIVKQKMSPSTVGAQKNRYHVIRHSMAYSAVLPGFSSIKKVRFRKRFKWRFQWLKMVFRLESRKRHDMRL